MPAGDIQYRFRIRTATDEADLFSVTTVSDGLNPYIAEAPDGDGSTLDPLTGKVSVGAYTVRVIDAPGVVYTSAGALISDGLEYANAGAMTGAGWTLTDTLASGTITVAATDQVHGGSKSLKYTTTAGGFLGDPGRLEASKTYTSGDGILADTLYRIRVYARADARAWYDNFTRLWGNGVFDAVTTEDTWEQLEVVVRSSATATLAIRLYRSQGFVNSVNALWFDDLTIEPLTPAATLQGRVVTSSLADSLGKQQLLSKRAFVEESEDGGATWTVLTAAFVNAYKMVDSLAWDFTVGESRRVEQSRKVFDRISDPVEHPLFIGTLDRASCLMGGPIVGDWGGFYKDRGRPAFEVVDDFGNGVLNLAWTNDGGSLHAIYKEDGPPMADHVAEFINDSAREYVDPDVIVTEVGILDFALAPDLICRIYDYDTSAWVADVACVLRRLDGAGFDTEAWGLVSHAGHFAIQWDGATVGDKYRFAVFPRTTSDRNPMHWSGHPMDLVANVLDYIGTPYDLTSLQAMGEALGLDLKIHLRITQGSTAQQFLEETVYGLFGIAARLADDGEVEFVLSRNPDTVSSGTVTEDEIAGELAGDPWSVDEASAVNRVIVETHSFIPDTRPPDSGTPFDAIRDARITCEIKPPELSELEVFGDKEVRFTLPGSIQVGNSILKSGKAKQESGVDVTPAGTLDVWCSSVAQPLFDWQGRGAIRAELSVRRGVTDARVGDVLTLDLAYFPSANPDQSPVSQRGTDPRRAVVLKRTVKPDHVSFLVEDRGLAETLACAPEFTLTADATFPKTTVTVEVTNEADLDHPLRIEMAQGASEPAGAGQFVRTFQPNLDANPFNLPPVCAGNVVWVRMRCELNGQVGSWSAWQSLDLADLTPPSGLSAVVNNTTVLLTWTNHETLPVEVLARLDAFTTLQSVTVLPAGSTSYTLLLTQASTDYVVGVRYLDPKGCTSSTVTVSTATDVAVCLEPPVDLAAFADGAGTYGVELTATVVPGGVEIWVATETAVESGTAGTYVLLDTVPALLSPLRTRWTVSSPAPKDGLLRFIKAESSQAGYSACDFSGVVTIDPWTLVDPNPPDGEPDPNTVPGLGSTVAIVPLLRPGMGGLACVEVGADEAVLVTWRGTESKPVLTDATTCRLIAEVVASTLPAGAYIACRFEAPDSPGTWGSLQDDSTDPTLNGPLIDVDPDSLDLLDANTDEDSWNVSGAWVEMRAAAADDVRVRLTITGGDGTGAILLGDVDLMVRYGSLVDVPEEIPDIPTEDPGSCDTPGDLVTTYASQAAAFAAEPTD